MDKLYEEGYNDGYEQGHQEGHDQGYDEGFDEGKKAAEAELKKALPAKRATKKRRRNA